MCPGSTDTSIHKAMEKMELTKEQYEIASNTPKQRLTSTSFVYFFTVLAVIKEYGDAFESFRWTLKKAIGAAKWQSEHQKIPNFSACKAHSNQHKIRIAIFERDNSKYYVLID